jgi:hypothetical protein
VTVKIFERVSGDTGPDIEDVIDLDVDLATADTVTAVLYRNREATSEAPVAVVDVATNTIATDLGEWLPTARSGDWKIKYRVGWFDSHRFVYSQQWTSNPGRPAIIRVGRNPIP